MHGISRPRWWPDVSPVVISADRVAILGDVHLGRPGAPLAFAGDVPRFAAWLEQLGRQHEAVIVNGDLYDLERGVVPFAFRRELDRLEAAHRRIVDTLDAIGAIVLVGNHDAALASLSGAAAAVDLVTSSGRVRVEHGHRWDAPIKQLRRFTTAVTWASGRVVASPARPLFDVMRWLDRRLTGENQARSPVETGATDWLAAHADYAALVIGHTHRPLLERASGSLLANPSGCVDGTPRWIQVDAGCGLVRRFEGDREVDRAALANRGASSNQRS